MADIPVIKPTYQYSYTSDEYITYTVYFINENVPKEEAPDHAAPHSIRRDFIMQIMMNIDRVAMQNIWFPIPEHEYFTFLKNKNFNYTRCMFQIEDDHCWIYIDWN